MEKEDKKRIINLKTYVIIILIIVVMGVLFFFVKNEIKNLEKQVNELKHNNKILEKENKYMKNNIKFVKLKDLKRCNVSGIKDISINEILALNNSFDNVIKVCNSKKEKYPNKKVKKIINKGEKVINKNIMTMRIGKVIEHFGSGNNKEGYFSKFIDDYKKINKPKIEISIK